MQCDSTRQILYKASGPLNPSTLFLPFWPGHSFPRRSQHLSPFQHWAGHNHRFITSPSFLRRSKKVHDFIGSLQTRPLNFFLIWSLQQNTNLYITVPWIGCKEFCTRSFSLITDQEGCYHQLNLSLRGRRYTCGKNWSKSLVITVIEMYVNCNGFFYCNFFAARKVYRHNWRLR